ncbi:hypothetical protein C8J56DRAFT_897048 [Mycena floridula]|nr:hypothetical protein C8J56DRAFT_897048 [Mycena floridula]
MSSFGDSNNYTDEEIAAKFATAAFDAETKDSQLIQAVMRLQKISPVDHTVIRALLIQDSQRQGANFAMADEIEEHELQLQQSIEVRPPLDAYDHRLMKKELASARFEAAKAIMQETRNTRGILRLGPNGLPQNRTGEELAVNKQSTFHILFYISFFSGYVGQRYFRCGDQGTLSAQYYAFKEFTVQIIQTAMRLQGIPSVHQDIIKAELTDHSQHQGASFAMTEETDEDYHRCLQQSVDVQTLLEADDPARIKHEIADARADVAQFLLAETDRMKAYNKQLLLQLEKDQRERRAQRDQHLCSPCGLMQNIRDLCINNNSEELETDNWWPKMLGHNAAGECIFFLYYIYIRQIEQSIPKSDSLFEAALLDISQQRRWFLKERGVRYVCSANKPASRLVFLYVGTVATSSRSELGQAQPRHRTLAVAGLPYRLYASDLLSQLSQGCLSWSSFAEIRKTSAASQVRWTMSSSTNTFHGVFNMLSTDLERSVIPVFVTASIKAMDHGAPFFALASFYPPSSASAYNNMHWQCLHAKLRRTFDDEAVDTLVDTIVKLLGKMSSLDARIDNAIGAMDLIQRGLPKSKLPHFDWDAEMTIINRLYAGPNALHLGINAQLQGFEADIEARVQAAEDEAIENGEAFTREQLKEDIIASMDAEVEASIHRTGEYMALVKVQREESKAKVLMMAEHILQLVTRSFKKLPAEPSRNFQPNLRETSGKIFKKNLLKMSHSGIPPFPTAATDRDGIENFWFTLRMRAQLPVVGLHLAPGHPSPSRLSPVIIYDYGAGFQGPPSVLISTPYDSDDSDDLPELVSDDSASPSPLVGERQQGQPQLAFQAQPLLLRKQSN